MSEVPLYTSPPIESCHPSYLTVVVKEEHTHSVKLTNAVPRLVCRSQPYSLGACSEDAYRGTSLIRKRPPPYDHHRPLGVSLLYGPRGGHFLMIELPLYMAAVFVVTNASLLALHMRNDRVYSLTQTHKIDIFQPRL